MNSSNKHPLVLGFQKVFRGLDSPGGISKEYLAKPLKGIVLGTSFSFNEQNDAYLFMQDCIGRLNDIFDGIDRNAIECFRFKWHRSIYSADPANAWNKENNSEMDLYLRIALISKSSEGFMPALRNVGAPINIQWTRNNGVQTDAILCNRIENPPRVFLMPVLRFRELADHSLVKNNQPMTIPITFDLPQEIMAKPSRIKYELIGGIVHSGTCKGGHYIAYIKTPNGFFEFNDSFVRRLSDTEASAILKSGAYILAYRRSN
jgi:hypothetical protein